MHILVSCLYAPSEASVMVGIAASEAKTSRAARSAAPAGPTHRPHGRADLWRVARLCSVRTETSRLRGGSETLATRRARAEMPAAPRFPVAQTPKTRARVLLMCTISSPVTSPLSRECFERRPWWRPARATSSDEVERHHLWWGTNGQRFDWSSFPFPGLFPTSMCNRLPGNVEVCTKTRLALNLRAWASENPSEPNFFPETFVVHARRRTPELEAFLAAARALESEDHRSRHHATWIFKPGASNRGRGIEIFARASEVERHLSKQPYASSWIVQKYVEAPTLVHGRKFDIRQFAAVAPDGSVWIYEDSYVRTCSARYDAANLDSKAIHLTNDAVQKNLETYGEHEDANKLSFDEFQRALDEDHAAGALPRRVDFKRETWPAIARAPPRACSRRPSVGCAANQSPETRAARRSSSSAWISCWTPRPAPSSSRSTPARRCFATENISPR